MKRQLERIISQSTFEMDPSEFLDDEGNLISAYAWLDRQPEAEEWQQTETVNYVAVSRFLIDYFILSNLL